MVDFEAHFSKGQEIEVGNADEGFEGSWYAANIVQTPRKKNKKKVLVEYKTLMDEEDRSKPLREYVNTYIVRPRPPPPHEESEEQFFELGEVVEVYHNDGWWLGTIHQVLENLSYIVYFSGSGEELSVQQSELRSHRQWIGGRWVSGQELQTIDSSFCIGASVEVFLDDENYRDAWFPAILHKRINGSAFLVEYQSLRLQYMFGKLKETVDSLHIRPFPPNTSQDKSFDLLEKVDAFYDCGWWSGVITKILAGSRYIVFFKHRHELKEFSHSELRCHMDWIDGKWIQNSMEISPQGRIEAPGQVQSGETGKTDQNIDMASRCGEDAAKNVAIEKSPRQVESCDAGKADQNIDMASRYGEDAAKNVAIEKSPVQAQQEAGNQSSPSKLGSPGHRQSHQAESTDQIIDMAVTPSVNAAKTVVAKKRKMQSTSESDTDSINSSKNKKVQSTSESDTISIISSKKRKKMQSTPESDTNSIISSKKKKKMQSDPESDIESSQTCKKLKIAGVVKTPLSLIACHSRAMATRVLIETDGQYDLATQTTEGQGANVEGKSSSENVEGKSVESTILAEMFFNCSEEGYKGHPKHLNSGQEQLKHVLESNGSRNQSSVEGSSDLPPSIIDVEQYEVVDRPTQVPARPMKLRIRPLRKKGEPLARDDIKQQTTKGGTKQTSNVFNIKTRAKVSSTKAPVKDVGHSETEGRLQAPFTSTEAQSKGVLSDNQLTAPSVKAITWKDSPISEPKHQNSLNVGGSSHSFEAATAHTLLDRATGDEVSECVQQSFLINSTPDQMLLENESFPFIKRSPVWEIVKSWEVFRVMPQQLHFHSLKQFNMELREGHAIGSMVSFANIVEKIRETKLDDPLSMLQDKSKALEELKAHGFNVQPIQARLETLVKFKDEQAKLKDKLMEVENQIEMNLQEKISVEKEHDELNMKIRELQEYFNQLIKEQESAVLRKEAQDSSMAELNKTKDTVRELIQSVSSEFKTVVATPW